MNSLHNTNTPSTPSSSASSGAFPVASVRPSSVSPPPSDTLANSSTPKHGPSSSSSTSALTGGMVSSPPPPISPSTSALLSSPNSWSLSHFRAVVPRKTAHLERPRVRQWHYYDYGPRSVTPLVCLHGVASTGDGFFRLMMVLCPRGYHVIVPSIPAFWSVEDFVHSFDEFLNAINIPKVHLLGADLGGYLAQAYAQYHPKRVSSLILCNSFSDTSSFAHMVPVNRPVLMVTPTFILKRRILKMLPDHPVDAEWSIAMNFLVQQIDLMKHLDVVSRLFLLTDTFDLEILPYACENITIIDSLDDRFRSVGVREEVHKRYWGAKEAYLKNGGAWPYLSRVEEFVLMVEVHLRRHGVQVRS